ncbi:hypothetical protein MP638_000649 [Amoeboaphelidium occidentale]|nr:hypothetical protein MP638_000649 [Amoeboaphelidium occidentale]
MQSQKPLQESEHHSTDKRSMPTYASVLSSEVSTSMKLTKSFSDIDLADPKPKITQGTNFPGMTFGLQQPSDNSMLSYNPNGRAAVFWDFENCPPPTGMPGYVVVDNIRNVIHNFGHVTLFKAYLEIGDSVGSKKALRSELQSSGVSLTDTPHNGRKDAADKMIMVDMLAFAIDNPPPATIVLISGDKDFVYALSTLRNRRYNIVLIVPSKGAPIILRSQANTILEWRYDVLNQDVWNTQQMQVQQQQHHPQQASPSSITTSVATSAKSSVTSPEATSSLLRNTTMESSQPSEESTSYSKLRSQGSSPLKLQINGDIVDKQLDSVTKSDYVGFLYSPRAPGFFDLLVEVLELFRMNGDNQPRRSKVGNEITRRNPLVYHRAGCSSFKEYVDLAAKEGIVQIGGERGLAWISLNENYRDKMFNTE